MKTLAEFLAAYAKDDNEWWRLDSGEHQLYFDGLLRNYELEKREIERLRADLENPDGLFETRAVANSERE